MEKRKTYVKIQDGIQGALKHLVPGSVGPTTCRIMVNIGLELVIAGTAILKDHGVDVRAVVDFVEKVMTTKAYDLDMEKGGVHEGLLRTAMKMVNGPIIRHGGDGPSAEKAAEHYDDIASDITDISVSARSLDPSLN
jgi:hypothetical protein